MPDLSRRLQAAAARLRDERGMTVVEVLVAAMLLLVAIVPTVKVFDDSRDQNATGEHHEIALLQAEQALEEMRGLPYSHLAMNAGPVDPGGGRVSSTSLRVRNDLTEPLVTYASEGMVVGNAWVDPVTQVTTGSDAAPVNLTVYRYVTWRDEECRLTDLSGLGVPNMPTAITGVQSSITTLINGALTNLINLLTGTNKTLLSNLKTRLTALQTALTARSSQLNGALNGISQVDLCDINSTALQNLQKLGSLSPSLTKLGGQLNTLNSLLCPVVCGLLSSQASSQVTTVNNQLDCMFGAGTTTSSAFTTYLDGILSGLSGLAADTYDTAKNTKRITVAVTIDTPAGVGPSAPVWATSVVRDPSAGLLTNGGVSCS